MFTPIKRPVFGTHRISVRSRQALHLVVALGLVGRSTFVLWESSVSYAGKATPHSGLAVQPEGSNKETTSGLENGWQDSNISATMLLEDDPQTQLPPNVSVYVVGRGGDQLGSLFLSHTVDRFGSRKFNYNVVNLPSQKSFRSYVASEELKPPCIIVRRGLSKVGGENSTNVCFNMVSGDESCNIRGPETEHIRHYYGKERNGNHTPYLPLGPYVSAWENIAAESSNGTGILLSSQRKFVFNAIFSENTSPSRRWLSRVLSKSTRLQAMPSSIQISARWTSKLQKSQTHMQPSEYAKVLLNSIFTLAPIGNNPESFRIFEAIESGSIPVIAKDLKYTRRRCRDALAPMNDAPFIYLGYWGQLEDRLEELMQDLPALEQRQQELQTWYTNFMTSKVAQLEQLFETDQRRRRLLEGHP